MDDYLENTNFIATKLNIQEVSSWQQFFFENEEILSNSIWQADINNDIVKHKMMEFISDDENETRYGYGYGLFHVINHCT